MLLEALDPHFQGFSWYDTQPVETYGLTRASGILSEVLAELRTKGIPDEQCVLMGFSQGGKVVWEFGARYPKKLGAYVVISSQCSSVDHMEKEMNKEIVSQGDWLITMGVEDRKRSSDIVYNQWVRLFQAGFNLWYQPFHKGHEFDYKKEIPYIDKWLFERLK